MTSSAHTSAGRRVVVGVDRSLSARVALEHAARRAGEDGSLVVAHAFVPMTDAIPGSLSGLDDEHRVAVQERVERLAAHAGVQTETRIVDGDAPEALAELASETGAEEIVVGSRGLGRFAAALGSVSHALLAHADRPVVVVPAGSRRRPAGRRRAPAAARSSSATTARSRRARRSNTPRGAPGATARSSPCTRTGPRRTGSERRSTSARSTRPRRAAERCWPRSRTSSPSRALRLTTSLLEGPPARAIVAAADARDADEIVVGSRGFGRLRGVLGSVSHAVLHEADRPVVVIPADAS